MSDEKPKDIADNDDLLALLGDSEPEISPAPVDVPSIPDIPDIPAFSEIISAPEVPMIPEQNVQVIKSEDENAGYVKELLQDFKSVSRTIVGRFQEDREEIQEVLDFLKDKVYNDDKANEAHITALSNTLRTKADASTNAVKLLDSYSKLLAAGKTALGGGGGGKGATHDMLELAKLLQQDKFPDEQ